MKASTFELIAASIISFVIGWSFCWLNHPEQNPEPAEGMLWVDVDDKGDTTIEILSDAVETLSGAIYYDSDGDVLKLYIPSEPTIDGLLDAIEWVESRGDAGAVGKGGEVGAYQITKQYVDDVNRIIKVSSMNIPYFTYEDRWFRAASREMTRILIGYYYQQLNYTAYMSYEEDFEAMARIHNAGPDGSRIVPRWFVRNRGYTLEDAVTKINNSIAYWELVKSAMEAGGEL